MKKICIVSQEDEITNNTAHILSESLEKFYVIEMENSVEGMLKKAKQSDYALIFINHSIHELNALKLTQELFKIEKVLENNTPIVIIAHLESEGELLASAFDAGAIDYIQKPIKNSELIIRTRHILSLHEKIMSFKQSLIISGSLIDNLERHLSDIEKLKKQLEMENEILLSRIKSGNTEYAAYLHDLKAPFSALLGNCQLLLKGFLGELNDRQKESIQTIERSTKKLLALIDDYIDSSRIQAGRMKLILNQVDVPFLFELSLRDLQYQIKEKEITLEINCAGEINTVELDIDKIIRVLQNLLSNAIKNTPSGGKIIFGAQNHGNNEIIIYIEDNGQGIPEDKFQKIFEMYEQGEGKTSGSGLGLSICKEIVEKLHYGKIWLESKVGAGSKFIFTLPVVHLSSDPETVN